MYVSVSCCIIGLQKREIKNVLYTALSIIIIKTLIIFAPKIYDDNYLVYTVEPHLSSPNGTKLWPDK